VEDDKNLADLLQTTLSYQQYQVEVAIDGQEGWELAETFAYDLILLDLMLPKLDGIHFCQRLRAGKSAVQSRNQETPVLLMTALDTVTNKVMGLDAGADDYVVKPINLEELQARIRALQRRSVGVRSSVLKSGKLCLHPQNYEVRYEGKLVSLSVKEYELLELFLKHPDQIFSQSRLIEKLWVTTAWPTENAVRAHIKELRKKLKQVGASDIIETVYKLGYRLRQEDEEREENNSNQESKDGSSTSFSSELQETWRECRESYCDRLFVIERAIAHLQAGTLTDELQQQAKREAHTLAGSLGSFGLDEASRLAQEIQQFLRSEEHLGPLETKELSQLAAALRQEIEETREIVKPEFFSSSPSSVSNSTLLIVDDDAVLAEQLAAEANTWGIRAEVVTDLAQAKEQLLVQVPDAILLDLSFSSGTENGLNFLAEMRLSHPDISILVFTASEAFIARVEAARLGCKSFLQKPIAPYQVLSAIAQVLEQPIQTPAKLMIVDDDLHILNLLQQMLEPQGYRLTLLSQAQQFWDTLEQTDPDLLILDVELSDDRIPNSDLELTSLNGFDLCQVVRNDPRWSKLPIVFLSAHAKAKMIQRAFEVGVDDFLSKPIAATELLTRINHRLKQRKLQQLMEIDELTGLYNRYKTLQNLTWLLHLARRQQQPLSLAMLDLDQFKCINDQYGHEAGDRVLRSFGKLLKQSFRLEDVVGRWGGEEFIVAMYSTSKQDGVRRLREVLHTFRQTTFIEQHGSFQVTFSAGVVQFLEDGHDLQTLYQMADAVLYRAKAEGRNCVITVETLEKGETGKREERDERSR